MPILRRARRHGPLDFRLAKAERVASGPAGRASPSSPPSMAPREVERDPSEEERRTLDVSSTTAPRRRRGAAPRPDDPGDPAPRDDLALVVQGHRHRPAVRPLRPRPPRRARHRVPPGGRPGGPRRRPCLPPRPHDGGRPSTSLDQADLLFRHVAPRPARGDRRPRPGPSRRRGGERGDGPRPRPGRGSTTCSPTSRATGATRPTSSSPCSPRRTRSTAATRSSRLVGRGRAAAAAVALPDDPGDGEGEPHRDGERVLGQRRGRGGPDRPALPGRAGTGRYVHQEDRTHTLMKVETHNHPTAISPFPGRGYRVRGRDPRRGSDRAGRQAQGRPLRLLRLEPSDPRVRSARGRAASPGPTDRLAPRDHDRGTDRGGRLQQRVRPPEPRRVLRAYEQEAGGVVRATTSRS